jgi:hypothetical protein
MIRKQKRREVAGAQDLDELLRIEKERGYKNGWAKHVWIARNGRQMQV